MGLHKIHHGPTLDTSLTYLKMTTNKPQQLIQTDCKIDKERGRIFETEIQNRGMC